MTAQQDLNTLIEAEAIKADPQRLQAAATQARIKWKQYEIIAGDVTEIQKQKAVAKDQVIPKAAPDAE